MSPQRRSGRAPLAALFLASLMALFLAVAVTAGTASAADPAPAPKTSLPEVEDEVMCPTCRTLLSLSASPAAQRQRVFIRKLINEGKTKDEILDALVAEYGEQVLAEPDRGSASLWVYIVPTGLLLLAAAAVIGSILRRRHPGQADEPGDESGPRADSGSNPSGPDDDRLDRDMARFDL